MNTFVIILAAVAGITGLLLVIALFTKKDYNVEREIVIDRPKQEVYDYIKHLRNQDSYSKWVMADPNMKKSYRGNDGAVGFVYAWDGNKDAGKGEQEIKKLVDGERMDVEIRFERPFEGVAQAPFVLSQVTPTQTRVRWGMSSRMKYPMNVMLLFMNMDNLLGKDIDSSLVRLKQKLEKK